MGVGGCCDVCGCCALTVVVCVTYLECKLSVLNVGRLCVLHWSVHSFVSVLVFSLFALFT